MQSAQPVPVDVVLPCLDEAGALPWVLERIPPDYRAIVADNGSTDGSADVARAYGATVVLAPRRGFGAACHAGLAAVTAEVVCFMDADASCHPGQLPDLVGPILDGTADLVLGARVPTARGAWPAPARFANTVLASRLRRHTGLPLSDLGPMRALRTAELRGLDLADQRFGYPLEMVLRAAAAGWRVRELPVRYHPRVGRSKVTGTVRGSVRTVRGMRKTFAA